MEGSHKRRGLDPELYMRGLKAFQREALRRALPAEEPAWGFGAWDTLPQRDVWVHHILARLGPLDRWRFACASHAAWATASFSARIAFGPGADALAWVMLECLQDGRHTQLGVEVSEAIRLHGSTWAALGRLRLRRNLLPGAVAELKRAVYAVDQEMRGIWNQRSACLACDATLEHDFFRRIHMLCPAEAETCTRLAHSCDLDGLLAMRPPAHRAAWLARFPTLPPTAGWAEFCILNMPGLEELLPQVALMDFVDAVLHAKGDARSVVVLGAGTWDIRSQTPPGPHQVLLDDERWLVLRKN
jgi:hypothetical protein